MKLVILNIYFLLSMISCKVETVVDDQLLEDSRDPFKQSSLSINDKFENIWTSDKKVSVQVSENSKVYKWCLSEDQKTLPTNSNCIGGSGSENGWSLDRPQSYDLSDGDGEKIIYLWLQSKSETVRKTALKATINLDTIKPIVTLNSTSTPVNIVNESRYSLSGSCSEKAEIEFTIGTLNLKASCNNLSWNAEVDLTSIAAAAPTLSLIGRDRANNESIEINRTLVKDNQRPVLGINTPANSYINFSNQSSYLVSGTCSEDIDVSIEGSISDTVVCSSGVFSKNMNLSSLSDGTVNLKFKSVDVNGNPSLDRELTLTKDTSVPAMTISTPANNAYVNISNVNAFTVSGSCSTGDTVEFSGDLSGSVQCVSSNYTKSFNLASASDGALSFSSVIKDLALNTSIVTNYNLIKDTVNPVLTESQRGSLVFSNANTVRFGGTCQGSDLIQISSEDAASVNCSGGTWAYDTAVKNSDGAYNYSFTHTEASGNSISLTKSWTRETVKPTVTSVTIADGVASIGTINTIIKLSATDDQSLSKIRIRNANITTSDCQSEYADDNWQNYSGGIESYSHTVLSGDGIKKVCVWAKDHVGNVSSFTPSLGALGVNMDTVQYEVGTLPIVSVFNVVNNTAGLNFNTANFASGDQLKINWEINDAEGLKAKPISLYYTIDNNNWILIADELGPSGSEMTSTDVYLGFNAPSSSYFRVKIVAEDTASNNNVETLSESLNTGLWGVYAGTRSMGIGGSYNTVQLKKSTFGNSENQLAVNPLNNDVYFISYDVGILKADAVTGKVSYFAKHTNTPFLFGTEAKITANTKIRTRFAGIKFDKWGNLYVKTAYKMYRVNMTTLDISYLYGGGSNNVGAYTNADISLLTTSTFDVDHHKNIYSFVDCKLSGESWGSTNNNTFKVVKATFNSGSNSYTLSDIIGNCSGGATITNGSDPLAGNAGNYRYRHLLNLTTNHDGSLIYFGGYNNYKLLNNKIYKSSASYRGLSLNKLTNELYTANGALQKLTNTMNESDNSESSSTVMPISAGVNCNDNGADASVACVNIYHGNGLGEIEVDSFGNIYFIDNGPRVRYLSKSTNQIQTALGTRPLYGEGLDKKFLRAQAIGGIHYKTSAINESVFPKGLYFTDEKSMTLGHIDPSSGIVSVIAGNQSLLSRSASGTAFDKNMSLGKQHSSHNLASLGFGQDGLPWFVTDTKVGTVNTSKNYVLKQTGSSSWGTSVQGDDPATKGSHYNLGRSNLVVEGNGIFIFGQSMGQNFVPAVIQYHDYGSGVIQHIMGGGSSTGVSADNAVAGSPANLSLSASCRSGGYCFIQYESSEDRLYFSEEKKIRYLTNPKNPSSSTLGTLTDLGRTVRNFIFSTDKKQLYYIGSDGRLYCYDLPGDTSPAHCNNSSLGPSNGLSTISTQGDQMTWKSSNELLINNAKSEVLLFKVP